MKNALRRPALVALSGALLACAVVSCAAILNKLITQDLLTVGGMPANAAQFEATSRLSLFVLAGLLAAVVLLVLSCRAAVTWSWLILAAVTANLCLGLGFALLAWMGGMGLSQMVPHIVTSFAVGTVLFFCAMLPLKFVGASDTRAPRH